MKSIILASNSPRRKELLAGLGLEFIVDTANSFDEVVPEGTKAEDVPVLLSQGKSHGFHRELNEGEVLISADTVVIVDDLVLGKPHSREEAVEMLGMLSGREHKVITAVTLRDSSKEITFSDSTEVFFAELSEDDINYYIDNFKPYDKAGAYGIQEWIGYAAIGSINGSFYNVMGLPVHRIWNELKQF